MRVRGHVSHGVVIIDGEAKLPDGTKVSVETVSDSATQAEAPCSLIEQLSRLAGTATDLPEDLARNHDHYLHGQKKR